MLKNYIHYVFSYNKIRKMLLSYNYSPDECRSALRSIRRMDDEVLQAFLHWVATSEYPEGYLKDVSVRNLVEFRQMPPPAAFLAADWMGKDPVAAGHFLSNGSKDGDMDLSPMEIPDDLKELVAQLEAEACDEDTASFESPGQK